MINRMDIRYGAHVAWISSTFKDVSKICNDLIDKVPTICSDESSVMTRFCQASCNKCDIVVADDDVDKLECKDYSDNCATKNLFDQKLGELVILILYIV